MYLLLNDVTGVDDTDLMTVLSGGMDKDSIFESP